MQDHEPKVVPFTQCSIDPELIEDYVRGKLLDDELFETYLLRCRSCQNAVVDEQEFASVLRAFAKALDHDGPKRASMSPRLRLKTT